MNAENSWPEKLFTHRLIFIMGKGGAGKTTLSVLLAMAASSRQKKVLLVELSDSDAIGKVFNQSSLSETPIQLFERIWGARINPKAELEAYTYTHVNSGFIASRITHSRLFDYLFAATPGLKEVMSLGRIWRWEKSTDQNLNPLFDLIIVDSPATGHGLSLLRLPIQLIHMIRVGPIVSQIKNLQKVLQDHKKTCIALVTLPEELPVNEALEFYTAASETLNIPVETAFINSVWPKTYTDHEIAIIKEFTGSHQNNNAPDVLRSIADAAGDHISRRLFQQKYIDQIKSRMNCPVIEVPFYFTNDLSFGDIGNISSLLMSSFRAPEYHHV